MRDQQIATESEQRVKELQAILFLLQSKLEEFQGEVDKSYALLQIGEKTKLTKAIEDSIENPLQSILKLRADIDDQVKRLLNRIVQAYFRKHSEIIQAAFKTKTEMDELHYSVVLKDDNIDNRGAILEFFDKLGLYDLSDKYPVNFQFVPIELVNKMLVGEDISLTP